METALRSVRRPFRQASHQVQAWRARGNQQPPVTPSKELQEIGIFRPTAPALSLTNQELKYTKESKRIVRHLSINLNTLVRQRSHQVLINSSL